MAKRLKRKPKKKLIIILIFLILILVVIGSYFIFFNKSTIKENKVVSKIPEYGYSLKSNKSSAYKRLFQQLKDVLTVDEVDEEKYVTIITKMFIIDFYSLNDHIAKTDVGGVDFIHNNVVANFIENAEDTLYKYVESNIYKQRNQDLPEVNEVTIESVEKTEFSYNDDKEIDKEAYEVVATWTYKDNIIAKGYQNKATFIYVHDGKKLVLVELSNDDENNNSEDED